MKVASAVRWHHTNNASNGKGISSSTGMSVSRDSIYSLLQVSNQEKNLKLGMQMYSVMLQHGLESSTVLSDHLIRIFISWGRLDDAMSVFSQVSKPSVYTWNAIISGHAKLSSGEKTFALYEEMQQQKIQPDSFTLMSILGASSTLRKVLQVHDHIIRCIFQLNLIINNALIHMYVQKGALDCAFHIFNGLTERDVVSWDTIILAYAQNGQAGLSVELLIKMQQEGIKPERVTFLCALKGCAHMDLLRQGKLIHHEIVKGGLESDVAVGTALVDMYAKCMHLIEASKIFNDLPARNVVSWGALLAGFVQHGYGIYALDLFKKMIFEVKEIDTSIFSSIVKACSFLGIESIGRLIHGDIIHCGMELDIVTGSMLLDMYVRCGSVEDGRVIFDRLPYRDVVIWGLMIEGYVQHGEFVSAVELFAKMQATHVKPDKITFLAVVRACGNLGAISQGYWIHSQVVECNLEYDLVLGNTMIYMYGKCGSLEDACNVFSKLPHQDAASWGAIIGGFAPSANLKLAEQCLQTMQRQGIKPNVMILSSILTACGHAGYLKEGWVYFKSMKEDHHMNPGIEHYNCMFDILGRSGHLHEALNLLKILPMPPDVVGWVALLSACKTYGNMKLAGQCCEKIHLLEPNEGSKYILIADVYATIQGDN